MAFSCANCRNQGFREASAALSRHVAGRELRMILPFRACTSCGAKYYATQDLARFDLAAAVALASAAIVEPEALKFMRKATGLRAAELADLLAVRPETISRWESGKAKIDRAAYATLRQLLLDRLVGGDATQAGLRLLMHPRDLPKGNLLEDETLARIIDRFGNPNGVRWMTSVDPFWIDRLIHRKFLRPPDVARRRRFHEITDAGREFADRVLKRTAA
jgi:DNA-binding transcriptional regulator YiaG